MDAAVGDELVERDPGDFAADRVERADDHHARRVVDDHVDAGGLFERADVAAFAADDAAFHFVAGDIDRAGRGFGGVGGGETLNRREQNFLRLRVGDRGDFLLMLHDQRALLVRQFLIEPLEQAFFGFFRAQAADLVEGLPLGIEQVVQLGLPAVGVFELFGQLALVVLDHLLLFLELVGAAFEQVLLLVEMAFAFERFLPGFVELIFDAGLFAKGQFLGFDFGFLVPGGGLDFGLFENLAGFLFGVVLSQIADQFDDAHSHDRGNQRSQDDRPRAGAGSVGWAKRLK